MQPSDQKQATRALLVTTTLLVSLLGACVEADDGDDDGDGDEAGQLSEAATATTSFQNGVSPTASYAGTTDAVLQQSIPTTNLGNDATLRVDMDYPTSSGKAATTVLRFDLSSIPSGSTVSSVRLTLNVTNPTSGEGYTLYAVKRAWDEGVATWNTAKSGSAWSPGGARGADHDATPLGTLLPTANGKYTLTLNSAGVEVVHGWIDAPSTNNGFVLEAPTNVDGLEFDSSEAATAANRPSLTVAYDPPAPTGSGLRAEYYSGMAFEALATTRTDATVNFDWGNGAPSGAGVPSDKFSVRWSGEVLPAYTQTYTFATRSDDGVRLWVNGQKIVDNWTNHSATENSGTVALTAGKKVAITLEYYENTGGAVAQLFWSAPSVTKQIVPTSALFPKSTQGDPTDSSPTWSASNPPAKLRAGESLLDDIPAGVPILQASSFSSTRDFGELNYLIDTTSPTAGYVQLEAGVYTVSNMRKYSETDFRGFTNAKRKVMGWIGKVDANGNLLTKVRVLPTMMSSSDGALSASLNATKAAPAGPTVLYLSNASSNIPLFISGIVFQGQLQTPFSKYPSSIDQGLRQNLDALTPIAYNGMSIWAAIPGSRVQFSKFEGFGFALTSAPPFENGAVNTNRSNGLTRYRCELDGRIAAELDATRPRASGGWMQNKETLQTVDSSWDHHTRRSGYATNTNTISTNETYIARKYLVEEIANGSDGWAGDGPNNTPPGFNGSNVEGVIGVFEYEDVRFDVARGSHFAWAVPYSGANGTYTVPDHVVLKIKNHTTSDTTYGGLTRVGTSKQPNSTGISPIWNYINARGPSGADALIDVRGPNNVRKIPVYARDYDPSLHKPATHYVLTSF